MAERTQDWLRQAEKDLVHAKHSLAMKDYEWVCFAAQQAAEKGLKAVYEKRNLSVKGHSIVGLLQGLSASHRIPEGLNSFARILSRYYIEARYPNGFPEGAPGDYFDKKVSQEAINASEEILRWCRGCIGK